MADVTLPPLDQMLADAAGLIETCGLAVGEYRSASGDLDPLGALSVACGLPADAPATLPGRVLRGGPDTRADLLRDGADEYRLDVEVAQRLPGSLGDLLSGLATSHGGGEEATSA